MSVKGIRSVVVLPVAVIVMLGLSGALQGETITQLQVIDLGTLGGTSSRAYGLNSSGDVVGYYVSGSVKHAFIWHDANGNQAVDAGERQDLGTLGGTKSAAYAINDSGQITGWANKKNTSNHMAFIWTDGNGNWQSDAGDMASLGTLGGSMSRGYGINNAGQVAGLSYMAGEARRAFRWTDSDGDWMYDAGETLNLGTLGGARSRGYGINSDGNVTGFARDGSEVQQASRWIDGDTNGAVDPGELVAIVAPSVPGFAWDINDGGEMAGYYKNASSKYRAFYYNDSDGMTTIDPLSSGDWSEAYAVDNTGMVVGSSLTGTGAEHAFAFDPDGDELIDLNDLLLPGSPWVLQSARDIEGDMVVGWGLIGGEVHAFLGIVTEEEVVVPEPVTLTLLGCGALLLGWRRRRRNQ